MSQVTWNANALDEGAADLRMAYNAIKQELDDLESDLEKNLSSWSGEDKQAYYTAKRKWDSELVDLSDVLNSMVRAVGSIKQNYMDTENKNTSIFT